MSQASVVPGQNGTIIITEVGTQGPAGLIWRGEWQIGEEYLVSHAIEHNGSSYRATVAHIATAETEPGAGADWEAAWGIVALGSDVASIDIVVANIEAIQTASNEIDAIKAAPEAAETSRRIADQFGMSEDLVRQISEDREAVAEDRSAVNAIANKFGDVDGAITVAESARDDAEASRIAAAGSAGSAADDADRAELAAGNAAVNANVYADIATGRAAVADGEQFQVLVGDEYVRYRRDSASTQTEVGRYPAASAVEVLKDVTKEEEARSRYLIRLRSENVSRPKAAIVVLLGQSLNVATSTGVVQTKSDTTARMFPEGPSVIQWAFASTRTHAANWDSVASVTEYEEGDDGQTPGVGILTTLSGTSFSRIYLCSAALGSSTLKRLSSNGPRANLYAIVHRFCDIARSDGYDPIVMFYSAHGEADAFEGTGTEGYYEQALTFYGMAQLCAAQAMEKPDYIAPVAISYPLQQNYGDGDREVKEAIRRVLRDLPNAIDAGAIYQWGAIADNVHPTPAAYVMRGEVVGELLRRWWERSERQMTPQIVDVTLSGNVFRAVFNQPVVRDDSIGVGSGLNPSYALDGFEWLDGASFIKIESLTYAGRVVTGVLSTPPIGDISDQRLRIAMQSASAGGGANPATRSGSLVRAEDPASLSVFDPTFTNHLWAIPQTVTVRAA